MRILYVTAIKPTTPIGHDRFTRKLSAYVEAGHDMAVVCGVDEGDDSGAPAGVELFPVCFKTATLPFSIVDALDEVPLPSVHTDEELEPVKAQLEEAFGSVIDSAVAAFAPDVIICSHLTLMTAIALDHAAGVPVAGISHSVCFHEFLKLEATRKVIAGNLERLDLVFACDAAQRDFFVDTFGIDAAKVKVLYGSCDIKTFTMDGHRQLKEAQAPSINIAFAGKFTYKNGVQSLFNAVSLLPCRPGSINVRLCGNTDNSFQRAALDLFIRENPQNIVVEGFLDAAGLAKVYRQSQVFVLPAFYDEFPLHVLEALACECKIVATDLPGLREWLEESVPGAPVYYVKPPRMQGLDEPLKCDIADFEHRMADAIKQAVLEPLAPVDLTRLSWRGRCDNVVTQCAGLLEGR